MLARAAEALRTGHRTTAGQDLKGSDAAWQLISEERLRFNNLTSGTALHEAEITATTEQAKLDYQRAAESKYAGAPLALPEVMERTAGLRAGDLLFVTAFASEGKSFQMLNDAHTAFLQGHNVAIGTGEMSVFKYRSRLIALHSTLLFSPAEWLETTKIFRGTLSVEEHERFLTVLEDFRNNSAYGKFFIFQFPYQATPQLVFNKFAAYDQIVPIDLGVVDYLGLMASGTRRVSRREELDDLIRETKALALDFRNGAGLAVEAGYQTNRQSFERARAEGVYDLRCFAESSEAEKSCDAALWILSQPQNPEELKYGFVKNRDDELGEPFFVRKDFKYARVTSLKKSGSKNLPPTGHHLLDV